jgi:hypothetical protein
MLLSEVLDFKLPRSSGNRAIWWGEAPDEPAFFRKPAAREYARHTYSGFGKMRFIR